MSDIGTECFNAVFSSLPAARIIARVEDGGEHDALCAAVGFSRTNHEMGLGLEPDIQIRMLAANVPATGMEIGKTLTLIEANSRETVWRVNGSHTSAGVTRFTLEAKHG